MDKKEISVIIKNTIIALLLISTMTFARSLWAIDWVFNNPYPHSQRHLNIYYTSFTEQPKTLDPARSYSANEYVFIGQIYEPPLQYNYLKRPYLLEPLTLSRMPEISYLDSQGKPLTQPGATKIAYTVYTLSIKPGIYYQPHPALAQDSQGQPLYLHLSPDYLESHGIDDLPDFPETGSREVVADDYIYQIKRLADPMVSSPIYGLLSGYIVGFREYGQTLPARGEHAYLDLRQYPLSGVKKLDKYRFSITLKGQYRQFIYWLSMPFFAPLPWEADKFYAQQGMEDNDITFDWYPIGTGPFMLTENNPNARMILARNPNYRADYLIDLGSDSDKKAGYLGNFGKKLPLLDQAIFTLEKESIPRWNKFMQGYYDSSGVTAEGFDQTIHIDKYGKAHLTPAMLEKKIQLVESSDPSVYYLGFNMLDPVVGGFSERARKLRQAISIAVDYEEYIAIFFNGRGDAAQGPVPQGIFGYEEGKAGINPYVYQWKDGRKVRRPIAYARQLMKEAGYPEGIDPKTRQPLILHYDVTVTSGPDDKAILDWMHKQFAKLGISLNIQATQYNQFQEKMRNGNAQIFSWGWNADYPDPENFLFLLYGPNGKVKYGGENAANYNNPRFNRLFEAMKNRQDDTERLSLIRQMIQIVRHDAPWSFGFSPEIFVLNQQWVSPTKPNPVAQNTLKYLAVDVSLRNQLRRQWNQPILWPIGLLIAGLLILTMPVYFAYRKKERRPAARLER